MDNKNPVVGQYNIYNLDYGRSVDSGLFVQFPGQDLVSEARIFAYGTVQLLKDALKENPTIELYSGVPRRFLLRDKKQIIEYSSFQGNLDDLCN